MDVAVIGGNRARGVETLEIERTGRVDIDQATETAFDLIGRRRFVDIDTRQDIGREIEQCRRAVGDGEQQAAVQGGHDLLEAVDDIGIAFTARIAGDLHTRNTLERFGDIGVGQFADIFSHDRIDDLRRLALDIRGVLQALAQAGDDNDGVFRRRCGGSGIRRSSRRCVLREGRRGHHDERHTGARRH